MVKKWFSFFGQEIRGLHEAAYLLASFAFLSLILALIRDKLLAYTFGAGHSLDVYYAAFRIPDLVFATVGSLVSASILLPYFIERFEFGGERGKSFSNGIFTVFFALMIVVSVVLFVIAPKLVPLVLPGFSESIALSELVMSMRIMLLSPFFLGLSNLFSSLTQMHHRFLVYALSPVAYNAGIILGVVVGYQIFGIPGLAFGVALGAFMHMAIQLPFLFKEKLVPRFTLKIHWPDMRKIFFTSLPRTLTLSANQIASFVLVSLASLMTAGSISVFNFAFNLQSVPLTLIGASYSSAVFPTLSRMLFKGNIAEFKSKMIASAQHIIFWSMPIAILFIVLRAQIVRVVLGAGKFDWADTRLTAAMLALFMISTIGQSLIVLFVRSFYAEGKTAKPLILNIVSAGIMIVSAFLLYRAFIFYPIFKFFLEDLLKVGGQVGTSVLVLGLAYTIGTMVNTILNWIMYERNYKGFTRPVIETIFQTFAASVIMGYAAYLSLRIFAAIFPLTKVWGVFFQGLFSGLIGIVVLIFMLLILRNKQIMEVWNTLHHKIWKVSVPPAEVERI